jgi:hypothetical protein
VHAGLDGPARARQHPLVQERRVTEVLSTRNSLGCTTPGACLGERGHWVAPDQEELAGVARVLDRQESGAVGVLADQHFSMRASPAA